MSAAHHGSRSLRLLHGACSGTLRSPRLLKKIEAGFAPATFRNRVVIDADPSGLGLNTLFAVSAGAKHVYASCPSRLSVTACERLITANGVDRFARPFCASTASGFAADGRLVDELRSSAAAMKPPLVTASLADLVELHPLAIAHYVRTLEAVRRYAPNAEAHASLSLGATLAHLPGHYRQCARVLGLDLEGASSASDAEEGLSVGRATLDKSLDGLNGGLVDYAAAGRLLHELGIPAQAWRIPVSRPDLGFHHRSNGEPSSAMVLPPPPQPHQQQRQQQGVIELCRIPLRFSESVTGSAPADALPVIQGRAVVVWASAFAGRGRGATPPLTSEPEAVAKEHGANVAGRSRRDWEDRDEFEALRAAAPDELVAADAAPVVLFVPDDVARRLVTKWRAAPPTARPRRVRNTVKGRLRAEREAGNNGNTTSAPPPAGTWDLEGQLRVSCRADGDADSLLFELLAPKTPLLSSSGAGGDTVLHTWS